MQTIIAQTIDQNLSELIPKDAQFIVHSLFQHACNLELIEKKTEKNTERNNNFKTLITLGCRETSLGANGIIVDLAQFDNLRQQNNIFIKQIFTWQNKQLISDSLTVILSNASQISTKFITRYNGENLTLLRQQLNDFLAQNPPQNGIYQLINQTYQAKTAFEQTTIDFIAPYIKRLAQIPTNYSAIKPHEVIDLEKEFHDIFLHIVGFGIGLTPSADDFIIGILIVLFYFNQTIITPLQQALLQTITRTTDVSQQMLRSGCAGHFGLLIMELFANVEADNSEKLRQIANYGHSSGHDMLCGVQFALICPDLP